MTSLSNIFSLFEVAISSGLKYPKIRLQTPKGQFVQISRNGSKSRYPGHLCVTNGAGYGASNNLYFGRITPEGQYVESTFHPELSNLLERLAADPAGVAAEYGKLSGNCSFCEKKLDNPESLALGFGPVCGRKYGLIVTKRDLRARDAAAVTTGWAERPMNTAC